MQRYGDRDHCIEVAVELGYLWKYREPNSGEICYDPTDFDYDPVLYRSSMNILEDMPLIRQDDGRQNDYSQLWKLLLTEEKEVTNNG